MSQIFADLEGITTRLPQEMVDKFLAGATIEIKPPQKWIVFGGMSIIGHVEIEYGDNGTCAVTAIITPLHAWRREFTRAERDAWKEDACDCDLCKIDKLVKEAK